MNATFSKKFNTAIKIINPPIILLMIFMHVMNMTSCLINESNRQDAFLDIMMGISFGSLGALCVVTIVNGMFVSYLNHLKILPFTKKDVKDISLINIFIHILIFAAAQTIITAIMRPSAIPYFICIDTVNITYSIGYLLLMFSDKRRYNAQALTADPLTRGQNVRLFIIMALGMISIVALVTFIYHFAVSGSLAQDLPMLIAITAAAIIISAVEIFAYRKKKIEF